MFIGEYETTLGEKNRVAIPKKLREELKDNIFVTRGYENCLILVDQNRWDNLILEINKKPLLSLNVRDTKRFILGGATSIDYDAQGRFVLAESLKRFANIEEKVFFIGVGEWIEIWSYENWLNKLNSISKDVSDIAERLSANQL